MAIIIFDMNRRFSYSEMTAIDNASVALSCDVKDIQHVFIDLDQTLYTNATVVQTMVDAIESFIHLKIVLPKEEAARLRRMYNQVHGTTLAGLVADGFEFDVAEYQRATHALEYDSWILPNPSLKELLLQIHIPKYIFTNGDRIHAERCLKRMEMEDVFEGVVCFDSMQEYAKEMGIDLTRRIICKPHPDAFRLAMQSIDARPESTLFIDDRVRNVEAAMDLGIQAVLVHSDVEKYKSTFLTIPTLVDLPSVLPELLTSKSHPDCTRQNDLHGT